MPYLGTIIQESLEKTDILNDLKIIKTVVEPVVGSHKTPWIKRWTLHTVEIPDDKADDIATQISKSLESEHPWYADFKNKDYHYIIFRGKSFKVDRSKNEQYKNVVKFGLLLGIPEYQLDFSPQMKEWER
jgi:hypothetical protein